MSRGTLPRRREQTRSRRDEPVLAAAAAAAWVLPVRVVVDHGVERPRLVARRWRGQFALGAGFLEVRLRSAPGSSAKASNLYHVSACQLISRVAKGTPAVPATVERIAFRRIVIGLTDLGSDPQSALPLSWLPEARALTLR